MWCRGHSCGVGGHSCGVGAFMWCRGHSCVVGGHSCGVGGICVPISTSIYLTIPIPHTFLPAAAHVLGSHSICVLRLLLLQEWSYCLLCDSPLLLVQLTGLWQTLARLFV